MMMMMMMMVIMIIIIMMMMIEIIIVIMIIMCLKLLWDGRFSFVIISNIGNNLRGNGAISLETKFSQCCSVLQSNVIGTRNLSHFKSSIMQSG